MSLELLKYLMITIMLHMQSCYCLWSKLSNRISIHTIITVLFWCTISALKFAFNWEHIHALSDEFWNYTHILKWLISIVLCVSPILVNFDDEIEDKPQKILTHCILNHMVAFWIFSLPLFLCILTRHLHFAPFTSVRVQSICFCFR